MKLFALAFRLTFEYKLVAFKRVRMSLHLKSDYLPFCKLVYKNT